MPAIVGPGDYNADVPVRAVRSEQRGLGKRSGSMPSIPPRIGPLPLKPPPELARPLLSRRKILTRRQLSVLLLDSANNFLSVQLSPSRRKDPYSNADMAEEPPSKRKCLGADCSNDAGSLQCPKCLTLGIKDSFFCSQDCFKKNWVSALSRASGERITC